MPASTPLIDLEQFSTFGDLLKYLRRRAGLTQRELSIAAGYSIAQISRLELNLRLPDLAVIAARFVPALQLEGEADVARRLMELAAAMRSEDAPASGAPPYKGLNFFDEADADLYFGREMLVAKLVSRVLGQGDGAQSSGEHSSVSPPLGRLAPAPFLAIVGASGSGKSSVARAGLVHALRWNSPSANWPAHLLTPTAHPLEALAVSLTVDSDSTMATATLMDDLKRDPRALHLWVRRMFDPAQGASPPSNRRDVPSTSRMSRDSPRRLVLVVDQFEELFTLCQDDIERTAFVDNLLTATFEPNGPLCLVITLRADFYAHCAPYTALRTALAEYQEYIGPMSADDLRQAIEAPAGRGGWQLEDGLADVILHDLGADGSRLPEPGALPLLSHALLETWHRRRGRTLTLSGYLASGGVRGAIAETAETVFRDQLDAHQQGIARNIFLRLTALTDDEEAAWTRRRVAFDELIPTEAEASFVREVLTCLADARLITTSEAAAEVAHEALLREWPRLNDWLSNDRASLRLQRQLTSAAAEWRRANNDPAFLLSGPRLAQFEGLASQETLTLTQDERAYLASSLADRDRQALEMRQRQQRELEAAQKLAETEQARANSERQRAEEQEAYVVRVRTRNRAIALAGAMALVLAVLAGLFGLQSSQNATQAQSNLGAARVANTQSAANAATAQANEQSRATQQTIAQQNAAQSQDLALISGAQAELANGQTDQAIALALQALALDPQSGGAQATLSEAAYAPGTIRRFASPDGSPPGVDISPDGRQAISGGWYTPATHVLLWDLATGTLIRQFDGQQDGINELAFSPDGTMALSSSPDGSVNLWNVATGALIRRLEGHTGATHGVAFSPNGRLALNGGDDQQMILWDVQTGQLLRRFGASGEGHKAPVINVAFSPDGRTALSSDDGDDTAPILWDVQTGAVVRRFEDNTSWLVKLAFSPDGQTAFGTSNGGDFALVQWDVQSWRILRRFIGHQGIVNGVALPPDGHTALSASADGTMILWDVATGAQLNRFRGGDQLVAVALSRDGHTALSSSIHGVLRLWDLESGYVLRRLSGHTSQVLTTAFSPDGRTGLSASGDGSAILWDLQTGQALRRYTNPNGITGAAYSPDGRTALISAGAYSDQPNEAVLWDVATGQVIRHFVGHPDGIMAEAISPDGRMAATTGFRGFIILWNMATGQEIRRFHGFEKDPTLDNGVTSVAFSPDGRTLLTGLSNGLVVLWDVATGQEIRRLVAHTALVSGVAFSPDGQRALSGAWDNLALYWDVATGAILHRFTDHSAAVFETAISPDGRLGLAGSADNTALLWDLNSGSVVRRYTGTNAGPYSVAFSADGRQALVGNFNNGDVALWRIDATLDDLLNWVKVNRYIPELTCDQRALYRLEPLCPEATPMPAGSAPPTPTTAP